MQINSIQNNNPSFNAKLVIVPRIVRKGGDYILEKGLSDYQIKFLKQKFEKATKDIKGTLELNLGERDRCYDSDLGKITYKTNRYEDSIPVYIGPESLSTKNEFVDKLVKMLEIFNMRKKNFQKISDLQTRTIELSQSTKASSYGAVETLFEMPDWRNNKYY